MKDVTMKVPDMSCGHCVAAIRGALEKVEGVTGVEASLDTKVVKVSTSGGVADSDLLGAVREVGYTPELAG